MTRGQWLSSMVDLSCIRNPSNSLGGPDITYLTLPSDAQRGSDNFNGSEKL